MDSSAPRSNEGRNKTGEKPKRRSDNFSFKENEIFYLLRKSLEGRIVLGKYENFGIIDFRRLKHIVIYHFLEKDPINYFITTATFNYIADQIKELMPSIDKELLYIPYSKEDPEGGSLYWYYKECRKHLTLAGILPEKNSDKKVMKDSSIDKDDISNDYGPEFDCLTDPNREKYNTIIIGAKWRDCFTLRHNKLIKKEKTEFVLSTKTYVQTFACLKDATALDLLDIDFQIILVGLKESGVIEESHLENYNCLFENKWPLISKNILKILSRLRGQDIVKFKNKYADLIKTGKHDDILALVALPFCIKATKTVSKSIVSDSFILLLEDHSKLNEKRKEYEQNFIETPIVYLIFCGPVDGIEKAYIVFNNQLFSYKDPLKAVGVCFKCCLALRYWPRDCDFIWLFIQLWVYKFPSKKSPYFVNVTSQSVRTLIQSLKTLDIPREQTARAESANAREIPLVRDGSNILDSVEVN